MDLVSVNSSISAKVDGYRAYKRALEGIKFLACELLFPWAPTLMCCLLISQILPFYLIVCIQGLGVALGVLMYHTKQSNSYPLCIPLYRMLNVPGAGTHTH